MGRRKQFDPDKIIQEALDYGLVEPRVERRGHGYVLAAKTPSGLEFSTIVSRWLGGSRPPKGHMCDLPAGLAEYNMTFVRFEKVPANRTLGTHHIYLVAKSTTGEEWKCRLNHWANGAAKPPLRYRRDLRKEILDYGLKLVREEMERLPNGSQATFLYIRLPDLTIHRMKRSDWFLGARPLRTVGFYAAKVVERDPELSAMPVTLYYVKFSHRETGETFYKIGITAKQLYQRFAEHLKVGYDFQVIREWQMCALSASRMEALIRRTYARQKYRPVSGFPNGGTECFSVDVLDMDTTQLTEQT